MQTNEEQVSLGNLMQGAVIESFDDEMQKVLNNIVDPNTDPKAVREVTLKVRIKPTENRDFAPVGIQVKSTLAPTAAYSTQFFIGKAGGAGVAHEARSTQGNLFSESDDKVTPIDQGERSVK